MKKGTEKNKIEDEEESNEEIDLIEVSMNKAEIEEVIAKLVELKEDKKQVQFPIASDVELLINYDSETEEENEQQ